MSARTLSRRLRTIAFYRDEIAIVALGLVHQALTAGIVLPGLTVAQERAMVVRIADVHAAAPAVHVLSGTRHQVRTHAALGPLAPATFDMPSLPVPELQAMRVHPGAVGGVRLPDAARGRRFEVVRPVRPTAPLAPAAPAVHAAPGAAGADPSESALRAALEHAKVEARVRAAVARALAAEQAARRWSADDVN